MNKNDNPEPIVKMIASSKEIYDDINSCEIAANKIVKEYKAQKNISNSFIVSDMNNEEYSFGISSGCFSSFFSSKFYFNLAVGVDRVDNYNSHALLNLMGYNFEGNENALKKNKVKF